MKLVSIENVKPPVYLAKPVYDFNGIVLLPTGAKVTEYYLQRLKQLAVESLYVDDGKVSLEVDPLLTRQIRMQVVNTTKEELLNIKTGNAQGHKVVHQVVDEMFDDIGQNKDLMAHLTDLKSLKDHTFGHSTNVCILSVMTALKLGYPEDRLKELATSALLHDIGKALLPEKIVNSTEIYSEEEFQLTKKHCEYGFEILKNSKDISLDIATVAWQHHERFNGSGYPLGLAGEEIHEFARIVAVADVYDALSTDRPYRKRMKPYEVVEMIRDREGMDFDPYIADVFISNIAVFPVGSMVKLNTGYRGIVVNINKDFPARPRVQLKFDCLDQRVEGLLIVDLMKELTLFVTDVIE